MKKTLALLAALLVAASSAASVSAVEIISAGSGTTPLTYTVGSSYTVTIPEGITLAENIGTAESQVSATGVLLNEGKTLYVKISNAANKIEGKDFRLFTGDSTYLDYTIQKKDNDTNLKISDTVLEIPAGSTSGSIALDIAAATATIAGTYTDTLTFAVSVE